MTSTEDLSDIGVETAVTELVDQAERLCRVHGHITRVIGDLDFPDDLFTDQYTKRIPGGLEFEPMLRTVLYMKCCEFSQRETHSRLLRWVYLQQRFGLHRAPTQQTISYTLRNRLSRRERTILEHVAGKLRGSAVEHDLLSAPSEGPEIEPEEVQGSGPTVEQLMSVTRTARERVFNEFTTQRASNAKYPDEVMWELQAYLSMVRHGGRETKTRATLQSWREEMPHKDTHTRAIKKMGTPNPQTGLNEFRNPYGPQKWKRIRDTLLDPFQRAIGNLFEETDFEEELREPVNVAIDITPWRFYPSPWKNKELELVKQDYPEMVSGYSKSGNEMDRRYNRGYKFATLTIIGRNTPIILAIEPVKQNSKWESGPVDSMSMADVVQRLLDQARQYVSINKAMLDRGFDSHKVRDVIDRRGCTYLIPKRISAEQDVEDLEEIETDSLEGVGVKNDIELTVDGRTHEVDFLYKIPEDSDSHLLFTTNADVPLERVHGLISQYRDRWTIENQYKNIKEHFLPRTTSSDYRVRLFYFVAGVLMYNVWRLTNLLLGTWYDVDLGEKPPVPLGQMAELIMQSQNSDTGIG